ncbi:MAG: hypothetical protein P0Y49_00495 [Candidatus Pedobacter colombiensis]|uniref:Uncharacterized protein n=1 Tax=Candidatus Pedobacter colombiensis TaxID=3121371 RepID=A0AAJ5W9A8_9SPHI|nr:hypothetical protein [Pedobacter sp.]WEK19633.1 MAG: hypothetical protein P0Y49_00495 [Pedobacter sp.]
MNKIFLSTFFVFYAVSSFAQAINVYDLGLNCIKQNHYLKAIDTIKVLKKKYDESHTSDAGNLSTSSYDQAINLFSSFIGEDYPYKFNDDNSLLKNHKVSFTPAIPYIINLAKGRRVVMINENHYIPKHRILTYNLLQQFYDIGYRYLALEALTPGDTISLKRDKSSIYANEPNMANLIREALRLGFQLIAYESEDNTPENPNFSSHRRNMRELLQARNLYQIIVKDPQAKILVHAGVAHIWEQATTNKGMYMAEYFKVISGIDPLTINQSVLHDEEFTARLDRSLALKSTGMPFVVLDSLNLPDVSEADRKGNYDLLVAWPTPENRFGRSDYMLQKTGTKINMIDLKESDAGNLLQVFKYEDDNGIPVDQFRITAGVKRGATALPSGKYQIQLVNNNGKILWKRLVTIP